MISKSDAIISLGVSGTFWELPSGEIKFADNYNGHKPSESEIQTKIAELEAAEPMRLLRIKRNRLLQESDWVTIKAYSQGVEVSAEWKTYLQALRDLPENSEPSLDEQGNLANVIWPTPPE